MQFLIGILSLGIVLASSSVYAVDLDMLHDEFMQTDPEILRAEVAVSSADVQVGLSRSELFPVLSTVLTTSDTRREQFSTSDQYQGEDYSLVLTQQVFDKPLWLEVSRQRFLASAQEATRAEVVQQRRLALIRSYVQWLEAMIRSSLFDSRLKSVEARLDQMNVLFSKQQISITEMLSVKNERDRVQAELARNQSQLTRAKSTLQSLVGPDLQLPSEVRPLAVDQWPVSSFFVDLIQGETVGHSVIEQAISRRAASEISLKQVESQWLPKVNARLQARQTNIGASDAETFPVESTSVELTMTWELFDSGRRSARARQAELALRDAELAVMAAEREVMRSRAAMGDDLTQYQEAWQAALVEYQSSLEFVRSADRSLELGVGTVSDSLRAHERLIDSQIRLTSRWLEALLGIAEMAQVSERLDEEFVSKLSTAF